MCIQGPDSELRQHAQVCMLTCSLATLERLRDERPDAVARVRVVAGFSLGEITALTFADVLSPRDALRLVQIRETAMTAASRLKPGGMLTVWLTPDARLGAMLQAARVSGLCELASYLYPGCKVLAGSEEVSADLVASTFERSTLACAFLANDGSSDDTGIVTVFYRVDLQSALDD